MSTLLRRVAVAELLGRRHQSIDAATRLAASAIVEDVRLRGDLALREHSERLGDLQTGQAMRIERAELEAALLALDREDRAVLERTAARIRSFAVAQRSCLLPLDTDVPGGRAGHRWLPVASVGAYAPGGRHPLPSSVLMTVIPARVAGVANVLVASPKPTRITCAAAALADLELQKRSARIVAQPTAHPAAVFGFDQQHPAAARLDPAD